MAEITKENDFNVNIEEMTQAGLYFGHKTSRIHPKMSPYLLGSRNSIHIIDLEKTAQKIKEALQFVQELVSQKKTLLLIGTKIQIKDLLKNIALECELPYVSERWLGGTFTNFETVSKRVQYLKELEGKKTSGELEKYTKKEQAKISAKIKEMERNFGGIKNLQKLPDAIFIMDMKKDILAVREAKLKKIKIIGIADTNVDPTLADYPIPANDDAISSVKYILEKLKEVVIKIKQTPQN